MYTKIRHRRQNKWNSEQDVESLKIQFLSIAFLFKIKFIQTLNPNFINVNYYKWDSLSASANTIFGLFPPSSRVTRFRLDWAADAWMILPTSVDPVKATLSTSMCPDRAAPAVGPYPGITLTTPGGKPTYGQKKPGKSMWALLLKLIHTSRKRKREYGNICTLQMKLREDHVCLSIYPIGRSLPAPSPGRTTPPTRKDYPTSATPGRTTRPERQWDKHSTEMSHFFAFSHVFFAFVFSVYWSLNWYSLFIFCSLILQMLYPTFKCDAAKF